MFNTQNETNFTGFINENIFSPRGKERTQSIAKALSHPVRVEILQQLFHSPKSITELSRLNHLTNATVIFHLEILEKATLIYSKTVPSKKGKTLIFFINFTRISLFTADECEQREKILTQTVGVGDYIDASFDRYIRMATKDESVILQNNDAFDTRRHSAQLLCTDNGSFTYAFGNGFAKESLPQKLDFSLEICSEAPYYRNDWKSEITFAVNGIELATYLSPGDFGGKRGELNPDWWEDKFTQYGMLVSITVTGDGVFLNGEKVAAYPTVDDLKLSEGNRILFRVFVKKNAHYAGGFNIFGKSFGNHPQDILMKAIYLK